MYVSHNYLSRQAQWRVPVEVASLVVEREFWPPSAGSQLAASTLIFGKTLSKFLNLS